MQSKVTDKHKKPSAMYTLLGGFLLLMYIIFLLAFYYKNNAALQESSLNRFQLDVANKAATIEYFFLERKYDIRTLADSQEIHTYFNNLDMGMSEQYGLRVSLFSIEQIIRKTIRDKTIDEKTIYNKIVFINRDKKILVMSKTPDLSKSDRIMFRGARLDAIQDEPAVLIEHTDTGHEILLVAPCLFKKHVSGWIIARLNPSTLFDHFICSSPALSSKVFNLTLDNGSVLHLSRNNLRDFPWKKYQKTIAEIEHPVPVSINNSQGNSDSLLFMRVRITPFPFYLTAYAQENEILGNIKTWQFLAGAAAMVLLILSGLFWSIRANIKHLILKTRFDESEKQQNILTEKNRQLREEISKRKIAEAFLIENEERYRKLFEFSSDAILIMQGAKIIACNQKTAELLKLDREEILNQNFSLFSPEIQPDGQVSKIECMLRRNKALSQPQHFEWTLKTADNILIDAEINMTVMKLKADTVVQVLIRDITERKRTQEILVQTEKMMAIGGLAAGMAHEINNPLGVILQAGQNIARRLGTTVSKNHTIARSLDLDLDTLQRYLQERSIDSYLGAIQSAGERAAKIVKSMLDFGRSSKTADKEVCDINTILDDTLTIVASDYDLKKTYDFKKIKINRCYGKIDKINCARTEIGQVFLNIIKNAAQAMASEGCGGEHPEITICTTSDTHGIKVTIADNGPGIGSSVQKSIFEPFFTTKPVGEGTGLGLSVSYFIITSHHNGQITVESEKGHGTRFIIRLPAYETEQDSP
jgi:PAS domain S-box-containing protein